MKYYEEQKLYWVGLTLRDIVTSAMDTLIRAHGG